MKSFIAFIAFVTLLVCLIPAPIRAQTRVLAGVAGGDEADNAFAGVTLGLEIPFAKRFEIDLNDEFDPYEVHVDLGTGWANIGKGTGILYLSKSIGLNASVEDSQYSVTKISKSGDYVQGGLIFRHSILGMPARVQVDYFRQIYEGITNGLETENFNGGAFTWAARVKCTNSGCLRLTEQLAFGTVETQGNPVCDGSYGSPITCPRAHVFGAGFNGSIVWEFARNKANF